MTGLNTCRKPYVCAGANSKGAAEEELENLNRKAAFYISSFSCIVDISISRLRVSLQAVEQCHGDAMTSLGLASGSGDDGVLPEEVKGV